MTENIDIRIREDGSRVVRRNIEEIGGSAEQAAEGVDILKSALGAIAAALAVDKLQEWSDAWGTASGLIRTSTKSMEEATAVQDALFRSAQKTRSEFSSVVELYSRASRAGADLGASQADIIKFSEGVGKALAVQGTSAEQASGALLQLGQALGGGKIQAEEYNSLLDGGQVILQTVAENLDGASGSVGRLTKMVKSGEVTSKEFFDAFMAGSDSLDAKFAQTSILFSQGWQVMENAAIKYVGQLNEAIGLSTKFGQLAQWVGENLPEIANVLLAIGAAALVAFAPGRIVAFTGQIQALWTLMLANPFVAVAAAIAGVSTYLFMMRDQIKLGVDDTTTLGDLMRSVWESVGPAIQGAADLAAQFFSWLTNTSSGTFDQLVNDIVGFEHQNESTWFKLLRIVVQVFDMIGGTVRGVMRGIQNVVLGYIATMMSGFSDLGKAASSALSGDWAGVQAALGHNAEVMANVGTAMGDAFTKGFQEEVLNQADNGLEAWMNERLKRAQELSAARQPAATSAVDLAEKMSGGAPGAEVDKDAAKKAARELAQLERALRQLKDQADPVGAAMRELGDAETTLDKAMAKGLVTAKEKASIYDTLKESMRESLDPFGYMMEEMEREGELLKLNSDQYKVYSELQNRVLELKRKGVTASEEQTAALMAEISAQQEMNRLAQVRDQLESESQSRKARDLSDKVGQAGAMVGSNGYTSSDAVSSLAGDIPGLDQTTDFLQAQQEQYAMYYAAIDEMRSLDLISEEGAVQAKIALFQQQYATQFQAASNALSQLSTLQKSENKKQAAIGKAAAIAQTIINTYQSATSAYAAMASIPYVGPFLGAAAAAAAVAAGMANVQAIRSQNVGNFRTGGEFMVGGSGGTDSQQVMLRATPGERIQINTPAQARALERADETNTEDGPRQLIMPVTQNFMSAPDRTTDRQQQRSMRKLALRDMG